MLLFSRKRFVIDDLLRRRLISCRRRAAYTYIQSSLFHKGIIQLLTHVDRSFKPFIFSPPQQRWRCNAQCAKNAQMVQICLELADESFETSNKTQTINYFCVHYFVTILQIHLLQVQVDHEGLEKLYINYYYSTNYILHKNIPKMLFLTCLVHIPTSPINSRSTKVRPRAKATTLRPRLAMFLAAFSTVK